MSATGNVETRGFQAEVKQLLHLMIHSLYSDREIFLRELISNASDACDKLRFEALSQPQLLQDDPELKITIEIDDKQGTLRIVDNGVGMSRDEVIENLGTIARSGTARFISQLSGDERKNANLIGQFGVGLYSAFMVADTLEVHTRRAGASAEDGVRWTSDGRGEYSVETLPKPQRGTTITLYLKESEKEFATGYRVEGLVRRYSDHIAYPVFLQDAQQRKEPRAINSAQALWTRPRQEIGDEEYVEFYKHLSHDMGTPLAWSHRKVEGTREYTALLYVPEQAPWDLWNRDAKNGLKLYVQRVFILDDADQFLPMYLRFLRGVVDAADLPLNVSREMLQQDHQVDAIRKGITRLALERLEKLAGEEADSYRTFWKEFGTVLKEGVVEDPANREKIAALLRFDSSRNDAPVYDVSLDDYLSRMRESQQAIYYLLAEDADAARSNPHLEVFRKHGIEVLLLSERIDEWLAAHLHEYRGKPLRDVSRDELDLKELGEEQADKLAETREQAYRPLLSRLKKALDGRIGEARVSSRLTDSPACLVSSKDDVGAQMRRVLEAAGQSVPDTAPVLEINPGHALIRRLENADDEQFADLAHVLFDQASLAEGRPLKDPASFVRRLNRLLAEEPED